MKGTNRHLVDTDSDGIPDGIEFLTGMNPLEIQYTTDSDFDGAEDWLEVQQHTNLTSDDPLIRERYSYNYSVHDNGLVTIDQGSEMESYVRQYDFSISNLDVMDTGGYTDTDGTAWAEGSNMIRFYIAQIPEDNPDAVPLFRMAEVMVNIADENKNITLTPHDFTLIQ